MQYLSKIRRTASSLEVTSCNYYIFHQIVVIAIAKWKSSLRQLALFAFAARRFHASLHEGSRCAQDAPQGTGLPIGRWRERTNFPYSSCTAKWHRAQLCNLQLPGTDWWQRAVIYDIPPRLGAETGARPQKFRS